MVVGVTGHRPSKLWGYGVEAKIPEEKMRIYFMNKLKEMKATEAITGMALGVDTVFARAVLGLKSLGYDIKLTCAIPCRNHSSKWTSKKAIDEYNYILSKADKVVLVSDCEYNNVVMQIRNEWMVDHSDVMIAIWDGSRGGTANCVRYADARNKEILHVRPFIFN